jgi:hypothetical protein
MASQKRNGPCDIGAMTFDAAGIAALSAAGGVLAWVVTQARIVRRELPKLRLDTLRAEHQAIEGFLKQTDPLPVIATDDKQELLNRLQGLPKRLLKELSKSSKVQSSDRILDWLLSAAFGSLSLGAICAAYAMSWLWLPVAAVLAFYAIGAVLNAIELGPSG